MIQKNQIQRRTKGRYNNTYKLTDVYKQYLIENPKGSDFFIDKQTFISTVRQTFDGIMNNILHESDEILLPNRLGSLSIIKNKVRTNKLSVDYAKSKELGMTIYHLNDHSNGYKFRFRWRKHIAIFKNRRYFSFIPCRKNKRLLAKLINEGKMDYMSV